jgi:hypothetical protein
VPSFGVLKPESLFHTPSYQPLGRASPSHVISPPSHLDDERSQKDQQAALTWDSSLSTDVLARLGRGGATASKGAMEWLDHFLSKSK